MRKVKVKDNKGRKVVEKWAALIWYADRTAVPGAFNSRQAKVRSMYGNLVWACECFYFDRSTWLWTMDHKASKYPTRSKKEAIKQAKEWTTL